MIQAVVFSKDRPMQLDALLRSIDTYAPTLYDRTSVVWTWSDERFLTGYDACSHEHPGTIFVEQVAPLRDVLWSLLGDTGLTAFHCDDDVFYRPFAWPAIWGERWHPSLFAFSLRLGQNTTRCYMNGEAQQVPPGSPWRWLDEQGDFGYPFSLDGHIYDAARLRRLVAALDFLNPNELEAAADGWLRLHALDPHRDAFLLASNSRSHVVSLPLNRVQDQFRNPHAGRPEWSAEALNERYLAGDRLDLGAMDFGEISAAHQVVEPAFARRVAPVT